MSGARDAPFGAQLRRYREAAGLTQEQLAERSGLTVNGISQLERGERRHPYPHTVRALAAALGLSEAERTMFAAAVPGRARAAAPGHVSPPPLPAPLTSLVGREDHAAAVAALLGRDGVRLLTLTGPGGVGKTRLAIEAAARIAHQFGDGVAFVALAALGDASLVVPALAQALGIAATSGRPLEPALVAALRPRQLLLVLDNCEHLLAAAPTIAEVVASCSRLVVLATSREPLRVRGEQEWAVAPLALPDPGRELSPDAATAAVRLFVERARAVVPDFSLTAANAPAVAAICRRLDGLPLALELAAAWTRLLAPAEILARLDRALPLLVGGARDLPTRQRTMRDTVAWSHALLDRHERAFFRRLAPFAGGCTLAAATAVCAEGADAIQAADTTLATLGSLAAKSLLGRRGGVGPASGAGEGRFGMLETIRAFAWEQLEASGEADAVRQRHAEYFLSLARRASSKDEVGAGWLGQLEAEHDNLRAALAWSLEREPAAGLALELGGLLERYWELRGHIHEGRRWLEAAITRAQRAREAPSPAVLAAALDGAGTLARLQRDSVRAAQLLEECLALRRTSGDIAGEADTLNTLGVVARDRSEYGEAAALHEASLALWHQLSDERGAAIARNGLGLAMLHRGEHAAARALFEESLRSAQSQGDMVTTSYVLANLGQSRLAAGDGDEAATLFEQALQLGQRLGNMRATSIALLGLARAALGRGDANLAGSRASEALGLALRLQDPAGTADSLEVLAAVLAERDAAERAATLLGAAEAARSAVNAPTTILARPPRERAMSRARATLGEPAFSRAWARGEALREDELAAVSHVEPL